MAKQNDPVYRLKHLVYSKRSQGPAARRWQRSTVSMLEPLLRKTERPDSTYGLLGEKMLNKTEAMQAVNEFSEQNCFSLLTVNPTISGGRPDWAQSDLINPTFFGLVMGNDGGAPQEAMSDWIQQMNSQERQQFTEIQVVLQDETRQLARNLSNDIGSFTWTTENNQHVDGPLMACTLSIYPMMIFFCTAVMMNEQEWSAKAMKVLNVLRFHLIFGAKRVQPSAWYVITR